MKKSLFLLLLVLSGCGLLHEQEAEAPKLVTKVTATDSCSFPKLEEFGYKNKENINRDLIARTANCFESNVKRAFEKIHGSTDGEISVDELRLLVEKNIIDLPIKTDSEWALVKEAVRFFHPKAQPALAKVVADKLLSIVRNRQDFIVHILTTDWFHTKNPEFKWLFTSQEAFDATEDLLSVISDNYRLSLPAALDLQGHSCAVISSKSPKDVFCDDLELKNKIEAFWVLKSFFFADDKNLGARSDLSAVALKNLIRLFVQSVQAAPTSTVWLVEGSLPKDMPEAVPFEWEKVGSLVEQYFSNSNFAAIDVEQLKWALKTLGDQGALSELSPDLVRFSQRLAFSSDKKDGLHPLAFRKLFREMKGVAEDAYSASRMFPVCVKKYDCNITVRQALGHSVLKHIAEKGDYGRYAYNYPYEYSKVPKRRDFTLSWDEVFSRLTLRRVLHTVFSTFSQEQKSVPLKGKDEELAQTLDLAYTFLRFATYGSNGKAPAQEKKAKEIELPKPVMVKPDALAKVMGLVGDKWILEDGNGDDQLDADEFVSLTQFYSNMQSVARGVSNPNAIPSYFKYKSEHPGYFYGYERDWAYYGRREYIENLFNAWPYQYYLPHIQTKLIQMKKETPEVLASLFHALIPRSEIPKPLSLWTSSWSMNGGPSYKETTLYHYVQADAAIAPTAILLALDRLILRCDKNEDEMLDWSDMECAMPLLLEAAYQTVSSELINLDPGVHDGAKVLLSFLQMKGIPLSIAKLLAANGSIKEFNLGKEYPELTEHLKTGLTADWEHIAYFIASPGGFEPENLAFWKFEAEKRYGKCDTDKNGVIKGEEWNCFVDKVVEEVGNSLTELLKTSVPQSALAQFEDIKASEIVRVGLKLATQSGPELDALMNKYGVKTGTVKILTLMENIVRRASENALAPKDTEP